MRLCFLCWLVLARFAVADAHACASLQQEVASLESSLKGTIRSYQAPRFHADLSRLDLAVSSSAVGVKILMSWTDLPPQTYGGGDRESTLRRSLAQMAAQIVNGCEHTLASIRKLEGDVSAVFQEHELKMQRSTQAHASMAASGANVFNPNIGRLGIENILMASHGAEMMKAAVVGQKAKERASARELGDAVDALYVPSLFTPNYALVVEEAQKLRTAHQQSSIDASSQLHDGTNSDVGGHKQKGMSKAPTKVHGENLSFRCPRQLLHVQGHQDSSQQKSRCLHLYLSVLASQAVYAEDPWQYLWNSTRPLAKSMLPWTHGDLQQATGQVFDHGLFAVFNITGTRIVVIAFKGTQTASDVWLDVQFNTISKIPGGVHAGAYKRSQVFPIYLVTQLLQSGKQVVITGHSLGGAVASVLTLRLFYEEVLGHEYYSSVTCITFGPPLFTAERLGHGHNFLHVVLNSDLVPRLLLFKKDVYEAIKETLQAVGFDKIFDELASAYEALPWRAKLFAKLGQHAFNLYSGGSTGDYKPFGDYAFLWRGQVFFQEDSVAGEFMQRWMPSLGKAPQEDELGEALRDHSLENYARELEAFLAHVDGQRAEL